MICLWHLKSPTILFLQKYSQHRKVVPLIIQHPAIINIFFYYSITVKRFTLNALSADRKSRKFCKRDTDIKKTVDKGSALFYPTNNFLFIFVYDAVAEFPYYLSGKLISEWQELIVNHSNGILDSSKSLTGVLTISPLYPLYPQLEKCFRRNIHFKSIFPPLFSWRINALLYFISNFMH